MPVNPTLGQMVTCPDGTSKRVTMILGDYGIAGQVGEKDGKGRMFWLIRIPSMEPIRAVDESEDFNFVLTNALRI